MHFEANFALTIISVHVSVPMCVSGFPAQHMNLGLTVLLTQDPCGADAGKYKCVAMNQFGEATANVNLNIEADQEPSGQAPVFIEKPSIKFEEKAGRVLMEALVRADPQPTSRWTKDGKELDSSKVTATVTREKDDLYRIRLELRVTQPTVSCCLCYYHYNTAAVTNAINTYTLPQLCARLRVTSLALLVLKGFIKSNRFIYDSLYFSDNFPIITPTTPSPKNLP